MKKLKLENFLIVIYVPLEIIWLAFAICMCNYFSACNCVGIMRPALFPAVLINQYWPFFIYPIINIFILYIFGFFIRKVFIEKNMEFFKLYKKKIIFGGLILFAILLFGLFLYVIQYTGGPLNRYAQTTGELKYNFLKSAKKENWKLFAGTSNSKSPFYLDFEGNYSPIFSESNYISQASISPDGKKVVFREGDYLNITDIDGGNKEKLLGNYNGRIAIYSSADNNEIAFLSDYNFDKESLSLYLFNIEDKSAKIIADGLVSALGTPAFSWSPDGEKIVFTSVDGKLMIINKDGSGLQEICDSGNSPAWSPDGKIIAYRGDKFFIEKFNNGETSKGGKTGDAVYYAIDIETRTKRKLVGDNLFFNDIPTQPVWSPNGAYILLYQMYDTIPTIDVANFSATDFLVIDVAKGRIIYNFSYDLRPSFMKWFKDDSGGVKNNDVSRFRNPDENRFDSTNANTNNLTCQGDTDCEWGYGENKEGGNCGCFNKDYLQQVNSFLDNKNGNEIICKEPFYKPSCVCGLNECRINTGVIAQTDKKEYEQKQDVVLTIENKIKEKEATLYAIAVEKVSQGKEERVRIDIECPCGGCDKKAPISFSNTKKEFIWDQQGDDCYQVSEGIYRFKFTWRITGDPDEKTLLQTSYSNEFEIKNEDVSCNNLGAKIDDFLAEARSCDANSDCIIDTENHLGCHFGCYFIRNKSFDVSPIKDTLNEYKNKCAVCKYKCSTAPEQKDLICQNNKCHDDRFTDLSKDEKQKIGFAFNGYTSAEEACDINLANSQITEESKSMMHYTCDNMADESKCYKNKKFEIIVKGDNAILYFLPFNHGTGWPFFFAKENGGWKIDFKKMAFGITMGGGGCDTGWGWKNLEIKEDFCGYFPSGECPENK